MVRWGLETRGTDQTQTGITAAYQESEVQTSEMQVLETPMGERSSKSLQSTFYTILNSTTKDKSSRLDQT
jgi:hypothetical protein